MRETWDISQEGAVSIDIVRGMADQTRIDMAATLERLEQLVTG